MKQGFNGGGGRAHSLLYGLTLKIRAIQGVLAKEDAGDNWLRKVSLFNKSQD